MSHKSEYSQDISQRFHRLWKRIDAQGDPDVVLGRLLNAYTDASRGHHNDRHIAECLLLLDQVGAQVGMACEMALAFLWHDVVYVANSGSNELDSMVWAIRDLTQAKVSPEICSSVASFILTYEGGLDLKTDDARYFRDIDYWIVGSPLERYQEYVTGIGKEYSAYYDERQLRDGRLSFLERLQVSEAIFLTEYFRSRFETQAKANIAWEIEQLKR